MTALCDCLVVMIYLIYLSCRRGFETSLFKKKHHYIMTKKSLSKIGYLYNITLCEQLLRYFSVQECLTWVGFHSLSWKTRYRFTERQIKKRKITFEIHFDTFLQCTYTWFVLCLYHYSPSSVVWGSSRVHPRSVTVF